MPAPTYEVNLNTLAERLKKTGARVIWCATTPVPQRSSFRLPGDEVVFNDIAARVMDAHGVPTDDLHAYALERLANIQLPANVHFSPEGSKVLAEAVVSHIIKAL